MSNYDTAFFQYVSASARAAAERIVPLVQQQLSVGSVLDVGCAQGAWLAVWRRCGVLDCVGVDGDDVDRSRLLFPAVDFRTHNLQLALDLGRRFDFVQCLEVAEHLPAASAGVLLETLTRHGDAVLFSAAPPGQGGHGHVNERSYEYWRGEFANRDFAALDFLRPRILHDRRIDPWYRYNPLLYVRRRAVADLSAVLQSTLIPNQQEVLDVAPLGYRIRKNLIRRLPVSAMTAIARAKERIFSAGTEPSNGHRPP